MQDLGILAYRIIGQGSIAAGSVLNFVHEVQSHKDSADTAIVISNPGQLLWHRRTQRAMTMSSWNGQPRKTGVSNAAIIDPIKNHVPGNMNTVEHVKTVFEEVVGKLAREDVAIDVIGIGDGAEDLVKYLDQNWARWKKNVRAICVGLGFVWRVGDDVQDEIFMDFWEKVWLSSSWSWISRLLTSFSSAAAPTSSITKTPTPPSTAVKKSAAIASPLANQPSRSASCPARTRACLPTSSW